MATVLEIDRGDFMLTCSSKMTSAQSSRKMISFFLIFSYIATDQSFPPRKEPIKIFELRQ